MEILHLSVTLEDIEPRVFRVIMVPADMRLDRLHLVIQAAMGWENRHLWEFVAGEIRWGDPDPEFGMEVRPATRAVLKDAIDQAGVGQLRYVYDFGDNWVHLIEAKASGGAKPGHLYPRLVEVEGRCPPEDVGGLPGYEEFLEAVTDPRHPDHEQMTRWYGGPFDPATPEVDELQFEVLKLAKRWKPRTR